MAGADATRHERGTPCPLVLPIGNTIFANKTNRDQP